jgi:GTP-binding protein
MRVIDAQFLKSATRRSEWPPTDGRPEVAICGRSNVGKSSLLNSLLNRRSLARVSRTPGRTRLLNFFDVTYARSGGSRSSLLLSDLPGFGYAEVSRGERSSWQKMMEEYLSTRTDLKVVVLLCDGRRVVADDAAEQLFDETELARYLLDLGRAVIPVITKADKLSKGERKPAAQALARLMGRPALFCSSLSGDGVADLWKKVGSALAPPRREATPTPEGESHESDPL